jgi:NADH-quinone oxidoreductase subunit A
MENSLLFLVTLFTGLVLFIGGVGISLIFSPRSNNDQKGDPYECGVPTRGTSWMQFKTGYYLYAILYLMFDVEVLFLFPWATVVRSLGWAGLISIVFFVAVLALGLAYAWRKDVIRWE